MSDLAPGLLVSAPPLGDPNFERSVVLLAAHGPDGAFGWIINGRELMTMNELLSRVDLGDTPSVELPGVVRVGGPVSPEQVWLVYRAEERLAGIEGQFEVSEGIVASASRKVLEHVAAGDVPKSLIAFAGYAGWAPAQLEEEIRGGAWLPTDVEANLLFQVPVTELWRHAYERVGTSPMAFTTRTVGSA
jgi:putative transcriptional regulator